MGTISNSYIIINLNRGGIIMNQEKIGKFIARVRKEKNDSTRIS